MKEIKYNKPLGFRDWIGLILVGIIIACILAIATIFLVYVYSTSVGILWKMTLTAVIVLALAVLGLTTIWTGDEDENY